MKHAFVIGFAYLAISAPARADALIDRIRAEAARAAPEDFSWTRTSRSEQKSTSEREAASVVDRWDPSQPPARRWTLVSVQGRPPTADEIKKAEKSPARAVVPSYGRVVRYLSGNLQRMPDAGGKTIYRFSKLAPGSVKIGGADLSDSLTGELTIDTSGPVPYISQVTGVSTKAVRMMLVARINRLELTLRYRMMANGRVAPLESINLMTGSMMGQSGTQQTVASFSDWRAR